MNKTQETKLWDAFKLLNEYLLDNTQEVFEELPEVDEARLLIHEALSNEA